MTAKFWYYQIHAREGESGFAEDVEYRSNHFDSFEECFKSYVRFKPENYWRNLRRVGKEMFVYVKDDITHITEARGGMLYYEDSEIELGITDSEFDRIIEKMSRM